MIFDADVHLSKTERNGLTAEMALKQLDRAGVDMANIWLQPPYMRVIEDANRYIYESAKAHPDRFVATGWVDPNFGFERSMDTLRSCVEIYAMRSIKFNGAQNNYYIDDESMYPYYEYLNRNGCLLAFHVGADFYEFTHPSRARKVAEAFPGMQILMVHMGGAGVPNLSKACIEAASACENMTLVGSAISYLSIVEAIKTLGPERVCFGSDAPFALVHVERATYEAFLPDATDARGRALIMGENAARLWELPGTCSDA